MLAQRRPSAPDSLVAIVMMSDENDCSIRDDGWVGSSVRPRTCRSNCALRSQSERRLRRSCAQSETAPPAGCQPLSAIGVHGRRAPNYNTWDNLNDSLNLRCYNQSSASGSILLYRRSVTSTRSSTHW